MMETRVCSKCGSERSPADPDTEASLCYSCGAPYKTEKAVKKPAAKKVVKKKASRKKA